MQNYDNDNNSTYDYRGKRGVVLLRVSTEEQERKYGFPSQLRSIREKLIGPLGIRIPNEETHIVRDTYTGMEFREREELMKILEMAKRREFDVLVMDVLDRLGRTGLPREIYRAELRMHGVRILTTKPEEHADDDSLMGQMIRLLHGFKSEEERNDIVRRTQNGRRERVLRDHKLLGAYTAKYGFKFKDADRSAYILDNDPIEIKRDGKKLLDENGEPWTKAKVRRRMFEWIDQGWTMRGIAVYLTSQHIPTSTGEKWDASLLRRIIANRYLDLATNQPILAYGYLMVLDENGTPYTDLSVSQLVYEKLDQGMDASKIAKFLNEKGVPTGREALWHLASVSYMLDDEYVIGKAGTFMSHAMKEPGGKRHVAMRPKEERIYLPDGVVPPILVTEDGRPDIALFERVQQRLDTNQQGASRNNHSPYNFLLRGGYVKCRYCGGNMTTRTRKMRNADKSIYRCITSNHRDNRCAGGSGDNEIIAHIADDAAWEKAIEIICDPAEADRRIEARRKADPTADRRQHINGELAKIKASRARLTKRLEDEDMDDETYADVKLRLKELADQKRGYESELNIEINIHAEWMQAQEKLKHFHKRCQEMREKLDDPDYEPDYDFKRDAIEFFGIIARVQKAQDGRRIVVESSPPSIASSVS